MIDTELRGIPFSVHDWGDYFSGAILRNKDFHEAEILDYIRDNHPIHTGIIDVGANIGNHTVYFANYLKFNQIWAFEPIKENFKILAYNTLHVYDNVYIAPIAVSDKDATVRITPKWDNMGASEISPEGEREVICITLDSSFVDIPSEISLIKIDVEWHEPMVLRGARRLIAACKPLILIEDALEEYSPLLPGYKLEKAWPYEKTYLYRWNDET